MESSTILRGHRRFINAVNRDGSPFWPTVIFVIATAWVAWWGLKVHALTIFDERLAVEGARSLNADPASVARLAGWPRGIERLTAVLLWPTTYLGSTERQFQVNHIVMATVYSAATLPIWGFLRGMKLSTAWAALGTAVCLFVPWAIFATTFLNTALSTTLVLYGLWLGWRSALTPRWWLDLLALAVFGAAGVARISYGALIVAWFAALLVIAFREAPDQRSLAKRIRSSVDLLTRSHPLVVVVFGLGLGLLALTTLASDGTSDVAGSSYSQTRVTFGSIRMHTGIAIAQLACATGVIPAIAGFAWLFKRVVRPQEDREAATFAVIALATMATLLVVNSVGGFDERYNAPAIVLLLCTFFVAISRLDLGPVATIAAGAAVGVALAKYGAVAAGGADSHLYVPGQEFYSRVMLDAIPLPVSASSLSVSAIATAILAGLSLSGVRTRRMASAGLGIVVGLYCLAGSTLEMKRFTEGQRPEASFAAVTFVDAATGGAIARPVADFGSPDGLHWDEVRYFNNSVQGLLVFGESAPNSYSPPAEVHVDSDTGTVTPAAAVPTYLLLSPRYIRAGIATRRLSTEYVFDVPVRLERVIGHPTLTYASLDPDVLGQLTPRHKRLRLRVFAKGARRAGGDNPCMSAILTAPPGAHADLRFRAGSVKGTLASTEKRAVSIPLRHALSGKGSATIEFVVGRTGKEIGGNRTTLTVEDVSVHGCTADDSAHG